MPELPEVETIKQGLLKKILNKEIKNIKIKNKKIIKNKIFNFKFVLRNNSFSNIQRIGKLLIFVLSQKKNNKEFMLVHLKMTGQLVYCFEKNFLIGGHSLSQKEKERVNKKNYQSICSIKKYTHLIFEFKDKTYLLYNDLRQFGYIKLVNKNTLTKIKLNFGIEPLQKNFTWQNFKSLFKNKKGNIKAILLNQKFIAGIGNIYADEILFQAGIRPTSLAKNLSEQDLKKIFIATEKLIKKAIKFNGTTFNNYLDTSGKKGNFSQFLNVYGRQGKLCKKCKKEIIKKIKIVGRGTSYCSNCQK